MFAVYRRERECVRERETQTETEGENMGLKLKMHLRPEIWPSHLLYPQKCIHQNELQGTIFLPGYKESSHSGRKVILSRHNGIKRAWNA